MSQVGTAGQATQLAVLQAAVVSTAATYAAAIASLSAAKIAANQAQVDYNNYRAYYFGNSEKPGVIDGSNTET